MKKITSLLLALVCTVGAWAQTLPFKTSAAPTDGTWDANTTWYFMSIDAHPHHSGGYLAAEGAGFISQYGYDNSVSKGKLQISQTTKPIKPSALWCVVGDETNGYTFYNKMNPYLRLGMPEALNAAKLYGGSDIEGVTYTFKVNESNVANHKYADGYCAIYSGTDSYWNDSDGENPNFLSTWNANSLNAVGSAIRFEEVTVTELAQMAEAVKVPVSQESDVKKNYFRIRNLRSLKYAMYNGDAARITQTDDVASIRTLWYVTEDGDGYHFYNAASSKKYAGLSSFTDDGTKMYIKENPYCTGLFCISTSATFGGTSCWDDGQNGGFSAGWTPGMTDYAGTSWYMEKVNTDDISTDEIKEELNAQIPALQAKFENAAVGMRELTEAGQGVLNDAITAAEAEMNKTTPDRSALLDQIRALNAVEAELITNSAYCKVKAPAKGKFYRLKNVASNRYMADLSDADGKVLMSDRVGHDSENRHTTIFYLDENNELLSFSNGRYVDCGEKTFAAVGTKFSGEFGYAYGGPTANVVTYKNNNHWTFGNKGNNEQIDRGASDPDLMGYNWTFEDVSYLPVPMNTEAVYGTIFSPVQLACGGRVEAYTVDVVASDNSSVSLKKVDYVPANTGVILKYVSGAENDKVYLQIQESSAKFESKLQGTYAATTITEEGYVLSKPADKEVGLYKAQGGASWLNNGFKAYLPASALNTIGGEAAMLTFDFGTETAIENVTVEKTNGAIYDLSGRRVKATTKGIFIINGKKVIK